MTTKTLDAMVDTVVMPQPAYVLEHGQLREAADGSDYDLELPSPDVLASPHVNLIPGISSVMLPRLLYGSHFTAQSLPLVNPEAPLVQSTIDGDPEGRTYDQYMGREAGAIFAEAPAKVLKVTAGEIKLQDADGSKRTVALYDRFPFNRKTSLGSRPVVKAGDSVAAGQVLAASNYTDDSGTLAMGRNARIAIVPYLGFSMDDAAVISEKFARDLASEHTDVLTQEFKHGVKGGRNHFVSLFPEKFKQGQLEAIDEDGVVKPGTVLNEGDPIVLATRPRTWNSAGQLGKLSRTRLQARSDASQLWEGEDPGEVIDVVRLRDGSVKVMTKTVHPVRIGDKLASRSGQKGVVAKIISDELMPRSQDGEPMDMLVNPASFVSRVNNAMLFESQLGKIAKATGKPFKTGTFTKPGESWLDTVEKKLAEHGLAAEELLYDPEADKVLENPVMTGYSYIQKLHHTAESKASGRGASAYNLDEQPLKGGGAAAQAKRLSGLESHALMSAGAYGTQHEGAVVRGQKNLEYWQAVKQGHTPRMPGKPFVWDKFRALLAGAGIRTKELDKGILRLGPMTDRDLDALKPEDVLNGQLVDVNSAEMEPVQGGLFDKRLVPQGQWPGRSGAVNRVIVAGSSRRSLDEPRTQSVFSVPQLDSRCPWGEGGTPCGDGRNAVVPQDRCSARLRAADSKRPPHSYRFRLISALYSRNRSGAAYAKRRPQHSSELPLNFSPFTLRDEVQPYRLALTRTINYNAAK